MTRLREWAACRAAACADRGMATVEYALVTLGPQLSRGSSSRS